MDTEGFVQWAMAKERTLEERFTIERMVEYYAQQWQIRHRPGKYERWEVTQERKRQRKFNPAYQPVFTELDLRHAAESLLPAKELLTSYGGEDRPLADWSILRWLPALEKMSLSGAVTDLSPLLALPQLRQLSLSSPILEDFRLLGQLRGLRQLSLGFGRPWPELAGIEQLTELEALDLSGNFFALPSGLVFPKVKRANLSNNKLPMRDLRGFPRLPACEILHLTGADRLDGIELMPRLRNLTITDEIRSFEPLTALTELTGLRYHAGRPLEVRPLARLPQLRVASFTYAPGFYVDDAGLRDYSPFIEAPALRELVVTGCDPVTTEVAAINAGLPSWGDVFLRPDPPPLPPLKFIVAPHTSHPRPPERLVDDLADPMVAERESVWVHRFVTQTINRALGCADWGHVDKYSVNRSFLVTVESYGLVEQLPVILDAMRRVLAQLIGDYSASLMIALKAPRLTPTPAQIELEERFRREQNDADFKRGRKEQQDYFDRLRRYQIKREEGQPIKPEEFTAPPPTPLPPAPWDKADEEDDDADEGGDVAVKKKPDPPPSFFDDEHPLADNYNLMVTLTVTEAWVYPHSRDVAIYLLGRQPDLEIPEPEPPQA